MKKKDLHIIIPEDEFNALKIFATKQFRTVSNLARIAIQQYLKRRKWNRMGV